MQAKRLEIVLRYHKIKQQILRMKAIQWIYTVYVITVFTLTMLLFSLFIIIPLVISTKGGRVSFIFIRAWAHTWSALVGIRYEIHGKEHIVKGQPYIYIFNHRSFLDAPVIPIAIPQEIRAMGKKELNNIPLFGLIVSRVAVWVDRKDANSRQVSVARLKEILNQGISVVVAPEGTRNDSNETLLPFQRGAFRIAVETQVPIMPMAIIGADKLMKKGSLLMRPGKVRIYFSKPIEPKPQLDELAIVQLSEKAYSRLEAMILTHE